MALGPVIVEIDSWWYERKHGKAPAKDTASAKNEQPATPQLLHRAA
jgi:hypothetical protein